MLSKAHLPSTMIHSIPSRAVLKGQLNSSNLWKLRGPSQEVPRYFGLMAVVWHPDLSTASRAAPEQSTTLYRPDWPFNQLNIVVFLAQARWRSCPRYWQHLPQPSKTECSWKSLASSAVMIGPARISVCLPSCKTAMQFLVSPEAL